MKQNVVKITKKGSNLRLILFLIFILIFIFGVGFFASQKGTEKQKSKNKGEAIEKSEKRETTKANQKKKKAAKPKIEKEEERGQTKTEEGKNLSYSHYSTEFFALDYPADWQVKKLDNKTFNFSQTAQNGRQGITVTYKENKQNLPIERFYDGINDVNLFEDASGGFEKITVGTYEGFKFKGVVGEMPATVVVLKGDKKFLEIWDNANAHQSDGIFQKMVESVEMR